jgi:hypothetical protein
MISLTESELLSMFDDCTDFVNGTIALIGGIENFNELTQYNPPYMKDAIADSIGDKIEEMKLFFKEHHKKIDSEIKAQAEGRDYLSHGCYMMYKLYEVMDFTDEEFDIEADKLSKEISNPNCSDEKVIKAVVMEIITEFCLTIHFTEKKIEKDLIVGRM